MLVRPLLFFLLAVLGACSRQGEHSPSPAPSEGRTVATSAEAKPVESTPPLVVPPSEHARDVPDVPMPHPASDNATHIKAWHILIAYKGAQDADPKVTRSRDEAKSLAEHVDIQARAGADFVELVAKYSDDPQAKTNHGNLGELTRTSMVKPFTDAAFALMKHEIGYDPVETAFGFHIIKRTE